MMRFVEWLQPRFKDAETVGNTLTSAGILVMGAGAFLEVQFIFNLGLALLGCGVVGWGVNLVAERELRLFQRGISFSGTVQEFLARAWGVLIVGGGLLLMGYGILSLLNPRTPIPSRIQQFFGTLPGIGILLAAGGLVGILYALALVFASSGQSEHPTWSFIKTIPSRLLGILLLIFFLALGIAGILLVIMPGELTALFTSFRLNLGLP